jgi:hypothetical protein
VRGSNDADSTNDADSKVELPMTRSRLKTSTKAVPAGAKKKLPTPEKAHAEQPPPSATQTSQFTAGDSVSHPKFGSGIVKKIDGDKLTIEFDGKVSKQIVDYYVKRSPR